MKATQISIFLENKKGRLAAATAVLAKIEANLRALNIADTTDFGILRVIVDNPEYICTKLKEKGFTAKTTDVIAAAVEDEPGALNNILQLLDKHDINLEYLYVFIGKDDTKAILIMRIKDIENAEKILKSEGITLLSHEDIMKI